jgi:hypothetical protein
MAPAHQVNKLECGCQFGHTIEIRTEGLIEVAYQKDFVTGGHRCLKVLVEIATESRTRICENILGLKE